MISPSLAAIVPVRSLHGGKTRLAPTLSPEARAALTRRMLLRVLQAALDARALGAVAVVSPDPDVLALAATCPTVVPLPQDPARPGLNPAIEQGRIWAIRQAATALLVLFGDLPALTADDVRRLALQPASLALAPDRHGTGTNALLLRLAGPDADAFRFQFGEDSYARHLAEARRLGLDVATVTTPGTALDLDTPADWRALVGGEEDRRDTPCIAQPLGIGNDGHGDEGRQE